MPVEPASTFTGVQAESAVVSALQQQVEEVELSVNDIDMTSDGTLTIRFNKPIIKPNIYVGSKSPADANDVSDQRDL